MTETMLNAALNYAARGWKVFPLMPRDKRPPRRSNGFKDGTTNPATIRRWFGSDEPYNIGVCTGLMSGGLFVFDTDGETGEVNKRVLEQDHGRFPATLMCETGNGIHYWFHTQTELRGSASRIAANIDIRCDGGYVVAPPSIHPNGKRYRWLNDLPLAAVPQWLVELTRKRVLPPIVQARPPDDSRPLITASSSAAYGNAALNREINSLAHTPKGCRNHALNRAAFSLGQLIGGQELHAYQVREGLIGAAQANGLFTDPADGPRAVQVTIESGLNAGLRYPRDRNGRQQ
jgi:hypothetical protein